MDYLNEFLLFNKYKQGKNTVFRALQIKQRGYARIFNQLCGDEISLIKWKKEASAGSIDVDVIEKALLFNGKLGFLNLVNDGENWHTPAAVNISSVGSKTFYGKPSTIMAQDWRGQTLSEKFGGAIRVVHDIGDIAYGGDCVIMYDNKTGSSPIHNILFFTERLSEISNQIGICIENIRATNFVFTSKEGQELIEKAYRDASAGVPIIVGTTRINSPSGALGAESTMLTAPGTHETLKVLYEAYDKTYADFLQSIGVRSNNEIDKKSGITPLEVVENRQIIDVRMNNKLNERQRALDLMKDIGITGLSFDLLNFESQTVDYDNTGNIVGKEPGNNETNKPNTENKDPE